MTDFALDALLAPIEGDTPTGPDLEYDAQFMALERAATPKAERVMGDEVKAAEEPDWDSVADMAVALMDRSKDLRIAEHLACAWLRTGGLPGWSAGMALVRGLLETYWDGVHPQLDAEDHDDPTARVNAIAPLASMDGALALLQTTPFVQSARLGRFSLRDLRVANGELKPSAPTEGGTPPPSMTEIEACCMDCPEEELTATATAIGQTLGHIHAIDQLLTDKVGTQGPDLKPLLADVQELQKFLTAQVARGNPNAAADGDAADGDAAADGSQAATGGGNRGIGGPQDVVRRIDEICEYYARVEPSSPVPLLLRRAQRLVGMSFADLMKDLAPSGVNELEVIAGPPPEQE
jgi:type VI secretion system protein ImpA